MFDQLTSSGGLFQFFARNWRVATFKKLMHSCRIDGAFAQFLVATLVGVDGSPSCDYSVPCKFRKTGASFVKCA